MGKRIIPEREVKVCDICERERENSLLTKCKVCNKEYCLLCNAVIAGCVHQPDLCKECCKLESVQNIVEKYVPDFVRIITERNEELNKVVIIL